MQLTAPEINQIVRLALDEDIGSGDVTTEATTPLETLATTTMVTRESLVVAGLPVAEAVFHTVSESLVIKAHCVDATLLRSQARC